MKLLEGKTVIITGASRGIGKGIAQLFAQQGAKIAFTYRSSDEKAKALVKELSASGCKAKGYKSDASDFQEHIYEIENLEDFTTFSIKLVLQSVNSTNIPLIENFRAIALST